ncbi:MAG: ABC transporter ATP-binding protein [Desulfobacterales bacterium]|nr:ABC transporter ATP-binding protein [Desulfobacterales bacterium]
MHHDFGYFEEESLGKPYDFKLLKRLYPFFRPYKLLLSCSVLLVVFITLLDLSIPYITRIAIDRYIVPKMNSADNISPESKSRYLRVDISEAEIRKIVSKYPDLFKTGRNFAEIPLNKLATLEKKELAVLRIEDLSGVSLITTVFIFIIIAHFGFNFLQVMLMEYTGQMIMHELRLRLFSHIQSLSVPFFSRNPVGRLVTRVTNDVQNMHELFTSVITFVFKDLFLLIGIAGVLLGFNWKLALISFAILPFVLYTSIYFSGQAREAFRDLRIKIAEINTNLSETIGGIKIIQLFRLEKENYNNFKKLNHENYLAGMRQIHVFAVFMPVIEIFGVVAIAIVIFYGGGSVIAGTISLGTLVAFISYMKMFFRPIRDIAEKYNIMQNAMASAERIFLILDNSEKLPKSIPLMESKLKFGLPIKDKIREVAFEDVSFSYVDGENVLKNIHFKIAMGESVAIVGPTGSGKTTLVNLIMRFYKPTSGRVLFNGVPIDEIEILSLRSKIALVAQEPFLFTTSIRDNIAQGNRKISEKRMEQILADSNCKTFIDKLPNGLETTLSEGGGALSSGERQLISIARAFARDPDLILLDEATSYIDSETERKIQEALSNLTKNRTAIIVAHRLSTARSADRIICLHRGRIIETGTHDELMQCRGFYYRLNQLQNL